MILPISLTCLAPVPPKLDMLHGIRGATSFSGPFCTVGSDYGVETGGISKAKCSNSPPDGRHVPWQTTTPQIPAPSWIVELGFPQGLAAAKGFAGSCWLPSMSTAHRYFPCVQTGTWSLDDPRHWPATARCCNLFQLLVVCIVRSK